MNGLLMVVALLAGWLATGAFLVAARTRGWGKSVRASGPASHGTKEGTPTMGGAAFLVSALVVALVALLLPGEGASAGIPGRALSGTGGAATVAALLALIAASGGLGLWDDLAALNRKRRLAEGEDASTGVLARWRLLGQAVVALAFSAWAVSAGHELFGVLALDVVGFAFVITGTVNALNMTDGLDGLAAGTAAILLIAFWGDPVAVVLVGSLLAFLWFNAHPAKLFMGGVGSEALGAALAGLAIVHGDVWRLPLLAIVPLVEVLSVMVQVTYFRATGGRRLLRMSPIHHHFELSGWPETRVVARFWVVSAVAVAVTVWSRGW